MKIIPILFLFFYCYTNSFGQVQKSWSLEQCIDYAVKNNIQIKQNQLNTELSRLNLMQSEAAILPNVNGNASHNYNFGQTIDPFTNQFATNQVLSQNFSISSSVNLFNGLRNYYTIKQNQIALAAGNFDTDKMRNDISLNVAGAYLQILFNQELLGIAQNQTELTGLQIERTKKLVDAGALPKGSILDVEAQKASEELDVVKAQNQLDLSYLLLTQLLNLDSTNGFSIVQPTMNIANETIITSDVSLIFSGAMKMLPEIKSAELKLKSAENGVAAAKGNIYPRLTLNGSLGTGYSGARERLVGTPQLSGYSPAGFTSANDTVLIPQYNSVYEKTPFADQINQNSNKSIGFYLTVPIFNGLQTQTNINKAKISKQNAQYNLDLAKIQLQKSIQQAYADANAALKRYYASGKAVDALQESFKYTEEKFNVGLINPLDYNISKNKLVKAQSDLLQAKFDFVFKTKILDFYQGKPLTL